MISTYESEMRRRTWEENAAYWGGVEAVESQLTEGTQPVNRYAPGTPEWGLWQQGFSDGPQQVEQLQLSAAALRVKLHNVRDVCI